MNDRDSLGDRLKKYEGLSTSRQLMPNCPVYARIDGRAFHTLCKGLKKPYSMAFIHTMQEVCKYLVEEVGAALGYVQSDEISLGWTDYSKAPFEGRIHKLESVLASMASAKFVQYIEASKSGGLHINDGVDRLWHSTQIYIPSFDCRVFNVPNAIELANCFLWRENDAIKNSISGMALSFYSHKQLQNKNSDEKIHMMRMKGYCFYEDTAPAFMRGTFYHRENYLKDLTDDEVAKIPEKQRNNLVHDAGNMASNHYACWRSHIVAMNLPYRLTDTKDLVTVLFDNGVPMLNKDNPTFVLDGKE
ncbi:MAG: tRNA(His) guanylyltransferase Thg1 family protein [Prevotella sp.]|nr:tRNA(His) guanylyltransferase Thg1 family protein [Prevotella sp.]